jgi:hypothetical protein
LGETLRELANFAAPALVFGQFVGSNTLSWTLIAAGGAFWLALLWLGLAAEGND